MAFGVPEKTSSNPPVAEGGENLIRCREASFFSVKNPAVKSKWKQNFYFPGSYDLKFSEVENFGLPFL